MATETLLSPAHTVGALVLKVGAFGADRSANVTDDEVASPPQSPETTTL